METHGIWGCVAMRVDPSNAAQFRYWDGEEGAYWAKRAARFDMSANDYCRPLLDAAAIEPTHAVLDIGCGTGVMTRLAAQRGKLALGVDLSRAMIGVARREAAHEHLWNAMFRHGDAQVHPFSVGRYDVAISRHGAMFFGDPHVAFTNIARALRPDGRMALLSWQPLARNEWRLVIRDALSAGREAPALPPQPPGSLEDPDDVFAVLTRAGFTDVRVSSVEAWMYFGSDADDACRFLTGQYARTLNGLDPELKARARYALHDSMARHQTPGGVRLGSASWLIEARKPAR
ncbi:class I SAM-dependent methyltransferase [Actinophytocola sp.]|uniref:class I SAM-dependent methyltransferase n=1 Tax=Actinophytocola sp. TaxID=1872138 RepID=UPI002ED0CEA0